jgi:carboxyl-terminal processing protease
MSGDFFGPIEDVEGMLDSTYVTQPDMEKLQQGAIDGMLEALGDPYAQYIPPTDRADFEKELLGRFCGIGAQVQIENGLPTIVTPLDDSPAFRAGILAGDKIVEVDEKPTTGLTIDKVVEMLVGEPGTKVHVKIRRGEKTMDYDLVRQEIVVRAVKGVERTEGGGWDYMLDPERRIGYIRLSQFIPTAADEMAKALTDLGAPDGTLNGLILDLRNNPGGDLDSCLEIADMFIKEGTIVSVRGREGSEQVHEATAAGTLPDFPMVVLVNGFSASSSEILSGALSDHHRATIIGSRTFGKGLVQTVRSLPHKPGAQVKYTIQHYFLPSGRLIQRTDEAKVWGVDPTPGFYIPMTDDDELAYQLKRRSYDVLGTNSEHLDAPKWPDAAWLENDLKDKQLAAAVRAMDTRIADGKWTPQSDAKQQFAAFSLAELQRLQKTHQRMLRAVVQVERRMEALDEAVAGAENTHKAPDLWPDQLDLTKGEVKVYDKDGKVIADLRITGPDLEQWLALADVEPVKPAGASQAKSDSDGGEKQPEQNK